jgi:hypothetical protein
VKRFRLFFIWSCWCKQLESRLSRGRQAHITVTVPAAPHPATDQIFVARPSP